MRGECPRVRRVPLQVLVTVFSRPQLGAILGKMEKEAAERWDRKLSERGQPGRWALPPHTRTNRRTYTSTQGWVHIHIWAEGIVDAASLGPTNE